MVAAVRPGTAARPQPTFDSEKQSRVLQLPRISSDGTSRAGFPLDLRPAGYLERLRLIHTVNTTVGVAAPTAGDVLAPLKGALDFIEVRATASGMLYRLTGEFAAIHSFVDNAYRIPGLTFQQNVGWGATPAPGAFSATWNIDVPIGLNVVNFRSPIGLYMMAARGQGAQLNVYFDPVARAATDAPGSALWQPAGTTTFAGTTYTVDTQQDYLAPIAAPSAQPTSAFLVTLREGNVPITGDGVYEIPLQQYSYVSRIYFMVVSGNVQQTTTVNRIQYEYSGLSIQYDWTYAAFLNRQNKMFNYQIPAGWFVLDFVSPTHSSADWLNPTVVTSPRVALTLQGTPGGAGQNMIRYAVQEITPRPVAQQRIIQ
jgi:hypothetical protein